MKHLATIQAEFLKEARDWDKLSLEEQKDYLKRHPKSKRKITAKPRSKSESAGSDLERQFKEKKQELNKSELPDWLQSNDVAKSRIIKPGQRSKKFHGFPGDDVHEYNLATYGLDANQKQAINPFHYSTNVVPDEIKDFIGDKPYLSLKKCDTKWGEPKSFYKTNDSTGALVEDSDQKQTDELYKELDKADFKPFPVKMQPIDKRHKLSVQKGTLKDGTEVFKVIDNFKDSRMKPDGATYDTTHFFAINPTFSKVKKLKQTAKPVKSVEVSSESIDTETKQTLDKISNYTSKNKLNSNSTNSGRIEYQNGGNIDFHSSNDSDYFEFENPETVKDLSKKLRKLSDFIESQAKKGETVELQENNNISFVAWDPKIRDKYEDGNEQEKPITDSFNLDMTEASPTKFRQFADFLDKNPNLYLDGDVD